MASEYGLQWLQQFSNTSTDKILEVQLYRNELRSHNIYGKYSACIFLIFHVQGSHYSILMIVYIIISKNMNDIHNIRTAVFGLIF